MTPEGRVKRKVDAVLRGYAGCYIIKPATGGYGSSGVPDYVVLLSGHFLGIECKSGGNEPTQLQIKNLYDIAKAGGYSFVVNEDNINQFEELLCGIMSKRVSPGLVLVTPQMMSRKRSGNLSLPVTQSGDQ